MPGPPTFVIPDVKPAASVPETWSFSGLRDFDDCPRRWALARTRLDCFQGPIPYKPNKCAVEGILLHSLVEGYVSQLLQAPTEPFRPRRMLLKLIEDWTRKNEKNPRINSQALAAQVAIEEVLRAFVQASARIERPGPSPSGTPNGPTPLKPRQNGAEVPLIDPDSKLRGRADFITNGAIVDFKTGEPQAAHGEQLLFYASLFLAATGRAPRLLLLLYTANNQEVNVPVPSPEALIDSLDQTRRRVSDVEARLAASDVPAKPEALKCSRCHVRGLCSPYWGTLSQTPLDVTKPSLTDFTPSSSATVDAGSQGTYIRDTINGLNSTFYLPQEIALKISGNIRAIRALALRATPEPAGTRLAFTQFSEVFVTADSPPA